jgi:type I restriction enzyme S subunit
MKEIPLVIPPISEQVDAIAYIENQSMKIERAISQEEIQIEKLKELRSTLIDSAVTGKIKVC